jgi:hypothetical protein
MHTVEEQFKSESKLMEADLLLLLLPWYRL